jgi:hypothetical protein
MITILIILSTPAFVAIRLNDCQRLCRQIPAEHKYSYGKSSRTCLEVVSKPQFMFESKAQADAEAQHT